MSTPAIEYDVHGIASRVMYELLGRRWVYPWMHAVDVYPLARDVVLTGRPVKDVVSVKGPDGSTLAASTYQLYGGFRLRFTREFVQQWIPGTYLVNGRVRNGSNYGGIWTDYGPYYPYNAGVCAPDNEVTVEYVYGTQPPEQVRYAIDVFAGELTKALTGEECRLPKRVTSVSRQGISMTILDPQDYLEKGKTGIPEVDLALSVFNTGNAKARARFFTDKNPPARRLSAVSLGQMLEYTTGVELPAYTFTWRDGNGQIIDFSSGYTFELRIFADPQVTKTTGIVGYDGDPNVVVNLADGEWDAITPGLYEAQLWANRTSDDTDRMMPLHLLVKSAT